ncbi:MAG: response regulator transcription factor [Dehalococcoidales bacterium]|nr:response regulator transcription factor [Dehalococcoidales bacterium]
MYALLVSPVNAETEKLVGELKPYQIECVLVSNSCLALQNSDIKIPDLLLVGGERSPEMDGVCLYLKKHHKIPIIALTNQENLNRLPPYADDFAIKPYHAAEIAARIKRVLQHNLPPASENQIVAGNLVIDTAKYEVYRNGLLIELTFKEYELLKFLAGNPGRVYSRDALLNQIWGEDYFGGDRTVDVHIRRLRGKIEDDGQSYIDTVRNIGYRFKKS